jgi:MSHA pilin protein MshD
MAASTEARRTARTARATRPRGLTLIELVIAIVVLGVALAGLMLAFSVAGRGSADPVVQRQLQAVAEEMVGEIALKPWSPVANAAPAPCARDTYNDLADYDGYATSGQVCTLDGTPIAALAGTSVAVSVRPAVLAGVAAARRITVRVSRGGVALELVTWRTGYAP